MLKAKAPLPDSIHKRPKPLGDTEDTVPPKKSIPKQYTVNQDIGLSVSAPLYCHIKVITTVIMYKTDGI